MFQGVLCVFDSNTFGFSVYIQHRKILYIIMDKARLGTVYLSVPKIRQGGYIPFFVTEKKRSEQALIQVVQECWLNGVSTRKIESIAKRLGIESLSASEASEINHGLDQMVDEFRTRRLDAEYPVIWVDALYEKIRDNHSSVLCLRGTACLSSHR